MRLTRVMMALLGITMAGCAHYEAEHAPAPVAPEQQAAPASAPASAPALEQAIRQQAELMHKLLMEGKVEAFVAYMDPNVVSLAGGTDVIVKGTRHVFEALGRRVKEVKLGKVSEVVNEGATLAAFVDVVMIYQLPRGRIAQGTYLVASSRDGGKTWKYLSSQCKAAQDQATRKWYPRLMQKVSTPKCYARKLSKE